MLWSDSAVLGNPSRPQNKAVKSEISVIIPIVTFSLNHHTISANVPFTVKDVPSP